MIPMNQKAGNDSTNFQVERLIVNNGISEQRVREIFDEKINYAVTELSREAKEVAIERINNFIKILLPRMAKTQSLNAFLDPDFQILLIEAQKSAASTEREPDIKLLTELLVHRFTKRNDRSAKIGISKAVGVVHQIPDEALLGLTVLHAVGSFLPISGDIKQGLDTLENLYKNIMYANMPTGNNWLDDLDVLGTIRISRLGGMKKIAQYYPEQLSGYTCEGILENSEQHKEVLDLLQKNGMNPGGFLVKHIFSDTHLRLNIVNKKAIDDLLIAFQNVPNSPPIRIGVPNSQQKQALVIIAEKYCKIDTPYQPNISEFIKAWDERPHLKTLKDWWDKLNLSIEITSVGRVLAHANAQRCDNSLPELD